MQKNKLSLVVSSSILVLASSNAVSAESDTHAMDSIVILGDQSAKADTSHLAGSTDFITREELEDAHIDDTMELFTKVPGVYFARYNQGIINTDIGIRGFAAEGSTPHVKLLIDGIPSNLHNGYSEMDQLFPLAIDSVEVFKGTSDARYGHNAVAGSYAISTRSDVAQEIKATAGSYDSREVQGYLGRKDGDLEHSYFLGYREADGYRDHNTVDKYSAHGRWFYSLNEDSEVGFIARLAGYEGDAPGYLSTDVTRNVPKSSADYANQDGGDKETEHYSLHYNTALSNDIEWQAKAYYLTYERERWVRFSEASSLQNRFDDQEHMGLTSTLNWYINDNWQLDWGLNYEAQDVIEQRFGTIGQTRQRDNSNVIRNRHYDFDNVGTYLQISNTPNQWVEWNAAVRADRFRGDFVQYDALGNASPREMFDFGTIIQPKLNLFVSPTEDVTLFANVGRTFQVPFGASAYTAGDTSARDVSVNDGWETGVKWSPTADLELRVSYWEQEASDEYVTINGNAQNVGETKRKGVDLGINWYPADTLMIWANASLVDSEQVNSGNSDNTGNELRSIPDYTASIGANYQFAADWQASLHVDSQGDSYTNEANAGGKFSGFTLVNVGLEREMSWGSLNLQVNNLFDRYYEYVYDLSGDGSNIIHSPGDGINANLSMLYRF